MDNIHPIFHDILASFAPRPEPKFRAARASELVPGVAVEYRGSWGRAVPCGGEIIGGPAIEAEQLVWDVRLDNGDQRWGYLDQFRIEEAR